MHTFEGGCHCGNLEVTFETEIAPADAEPRACQCSFCRKHNTRALSDPEGRIEIVVFDPDKFSRYKFGTGATEFLVCANCGVYVAAYMADGDQAYANVTASALIAHAEFTRPARSIEYHDENEAEKRARRRRVWTPAALIIAGG
ncbi:MAG: aldehyde-activating protein [Proteobacteria bacterium]|nr:aldehyde-activating protein [Pseudomonadota bacterium]